MPGRWFESLFEIAADQYGFVTTNDVRDLGGGPGVLVDMCRHGHLERTSRGLYRFVSFPTGPRDELMAATLWARGRGVISHDSALELWDLCDVNPARIHLSVPRAVRLRRAAPLPYVVHRRDLADSEIFRVEGIATVTPIRAILDGIEAHIDDRLLTQARSNATARGLLDEHDLERLTDGVAGG